MNIGFDAKRAFSNKSGLGNYARNLISGIIKNNPIDNYFLFNSDKGRYKMHDFLEKRSNIHLIEPETFWAKHFPDWWRSYGATKQINELELDIFHGLSNELPLNIQKSSVKKVVTVHDLIFLRYPEFYAAADRKIYEMKVRKACNVADAVVAVSQQTKTDLIDFLQVPEQKIKVIYQTCDEHFFRADDYTTNINSPEKLLPQEYVLYVGTIEERKNLSALVRAIHELDKTMQVNLVVVGKETSYAKEVKDYVSRYGLDKRVYFMKSVNNALLPLIYRKAKAFIYPSLFEGFGIPVLEALVSKVPVITSKGSCFLESGGPNSLFVDPENADEIAEAIKRVLTDEELRKNMIEKGYEYAQQFRPEVCAQNMYDLYTSLLD